LSLSLAFLSNLKSQTSNRPSPATPSSSCCLLCDANLRAASWFCLLVGATCFSRGSWTSVRRKNARSQNGLPFTLNAVANGRLMPPGALNREGICFFSSLSFFVSAYVAAAFPFRRALLFEVFAEGDAWNHFVIGVEKGGARSNSARSPQRASVTRKFLRRFIRIKQ
jgi:hypothetical protein